MQRNLKGLNYCTTVFKLTGSPYTAGVINPRMDWYLIQRGSGNIPVTSHYKSKDKLQFDTFTIKMLLMTTYICHNQHYQ